MTRERVPLGWAYSNHGLAHALEAVARRVIGPALMKEAIVRMRGAVEVYREGRITYWLPRAQDSLARMEAELAEMDEP